MQVEDERNVSWHSKGVICKKTGGLAGVPPAEREAGLASPQAKPFARKHFRHARCYSLSPCSGERENRHAFAAKLPSKVFVRSTCALANSGSSVFSMSMVLAMPACGMMPVLE